jgi:translation initiation factor IF-2
MLANTLPTKFEERETGEARIQQLWSHSAIGTIAGCKVTSGEIKRSDSARILRKGIVLHQTKIKSLKHVKEVIDKAVNGMEFGITFLEFNDLQVDDIIQSYELIAISNEK